MELKQYFNIMLKRWWIIVALTLAAGIAAALVSFFVLEPVYEASTTLYVINKQPDVQASIAYNDVMAGQLLVNDYREIVKSAAITSSVIDGLGLEGQTPEGLAEKISVDSKNDTRVIEIKVQDKDPETAVAIADKLGNVFVSKVKELMKVETVSILDSARLPKEPVKPQPYINIALAVFAALFMAIGIIFLMEYLDDTIKTAEDVEKHLGLTVLGTIPVLNMR